MLPVALCSVLLTLSAHAGKNPKVTIDQPLPSGAKVAVVQYAVDAMNAGSGHTVTMDLEQVDASMDLQIELLERTLEESGLFAEVIPATAFSADAGYRRDAQPLFTGRRKGERVVDVCDSKLFCAKDLPVFVADKGLDVDASLSRAAAAASGADLVLYVYGFYFLKPGMQKKAVFRGWFALYDAEGERQSMVKLSNEQASGVLPMGSEAVRSWESAAERAFVSYVEQVGQ